MFKKNKFSLSESASSSEVELKEPDETSSPTPSICTTISASSSNKPLIFSGREEGSIGASGTLSIVSGLSGI
jgi:hypothetical protein